MNFFIKILMEKLNTPESKNRDKNAKNNEIMSNHAKKLIFLAIFQNNTIKTQITAINSPIMKSELKIV